jgi:putative flavoprotein involved in K+ transport
VPGIPNKPQLSSSGLLGWRVGWWLLGHVTSDTKLGQKATRFSRHQGAPLIRLKPKDLSKAGVERVGRTEKVVNGKPVLADGRVLTVKSIVWATGFKPNFAWMQLPIFDEDGYPLHLVV